MGGGTPAQTQQTSKVELPAWVNEASQQNYQMAKDVSGRPLEQFQGDRVAAPSDMSTQGYGILKSGAGSETGMYNDAADIFKRTSGPMDVGSYMNPYTNDVEKRAIGNANTSLDQQLRGVTDRASKAGAFGGSRAAVESGVTRAEGVRGIGDLSAQLRQQGFDTASRNALADRSGMQAGASGILSTATGRQGARLGDASSLLGAGASETGSRQKLIDAQMGKFDEARNYPIEQLNMRLAALGMSPYGKTESSNKTATAEQSPMDFATTGLGFLKTLPALVGMFSDREAKTDIQKLTDGEIPLYAYRYKGDPKSYPKVVGPMAQDIEKKVPRAVKKVGKHRVVDINNLMEALS
jgi:hypothetical protein